ncbi:MAG: FMN-binding glutamate synthase family protein, partial [bacterium]|nr:FMN-binding glutamate synthase family protein [bacterium]
MARYRCPLCGYIFDEEKEGKTLEEMGVCPLCKKPYTDFELMGDEPAEEAKPAATPTASSDASDLSYDPMFSRKDDHFRCMDEIQQIAVTGKTIHAAMATKLPLPSWDDILMLGAQLDPAPLDDGAPVSTETIIGRNAAKPMVLATPIFISHMSYGALSQEAKVALAMGSARVKTAMCSGEGGILPEERNASYKYIFEYVPNKYSASNENLKDVDAIEIKIGQGTKPGMGGHLPGEKVTPEIAKIRGRAVGQDIQSPSKFPDINEPVDLLNLV